MFDLSDVTLGSDPEVFVVRKRHFISGHTFVSGTKHEPQPTAHGFVQQDGIALEFNTHPAKTRDGFIANTTAAYRDVQEIVRRTDPTARVVARPSVWVGTRFLDDLPVQNSMLGCTPDYNAYTRKQNERPDARSPMRTGAGHIHIGWNARAIPTSRQHLAICCDVVKMLDVFVGVPSLVWDRDARRRSLYGQPGAFRPTRYGVEYRVLSNAWLSSSELMGEVYDRTLAGLRAFLTNHENSDQELLEDAARLASVSFSRNDPSILLSSRTFSALSGV